MQHLFSERCMRKEGRSNNVVALGLMLIDLVILLKGADTSTWLVYRISSSWLYKRRQDTVLKDILPITKLLSRSLHGGFLLRHVISQRDFLYHANRVEPIGSKPQKDYNSELCLYLPGMYKDMDVNAGEDANFIG